MTAHSNQVAIEAFNLRKVYGHGNTEVVAMNDVSLQVRRGEVVALLGPSGAGKSTLLTAMGLINPPTSCRIEIGGSLVLDGANAQVDLRAFRRKHLGFVFQKAHLIPFLNAVQNVQLAMEINDVAPTRAQAAGKGVAGLFRGRRSGPKHARHALRRAATACRRSTGPRKRTGSHPRRRTDRRA